MGGLRTDVERLTNLVPDPQGQTAGLVPVVSTFVDSRGITQYTYTLQAVAPGSAQTKIQFQYNGSNLGTSGSVDTYNVVSSTATFTRAGNTVTLTIPTGLASPLTTKGDIWGFSTVNARIPVGSDGQILTADSTQGLGVKWAAAPSTGVTLVMPAEFSVAGSGTSSITVTKANESANTVWAGPSSGGAAAPTFRALVRADIPGFSGGLSFRLGRTDGAVLLANFQRVFLLPADYDQITSGTWEIVTYPSSTCSIDIQYRAFGTTRPTTANSIVGATHPATTGSVTATGSMVGWTSSSIAKGGYIAIQVLTNDLAREILFYMPARRT